VSDSWYFATPGLPNISSGLAAFIAVDVDKLWVQSPFESDIGAEGNPLNAPVRSFIHQGSGSVYYTYQTPLGLYNYFLIDSPNQQDAFTFAANGNTKCSIFVRRGAANLLGGAGPLERLFVGGSFGVGPYVTIGANFGGVTYYYQSGGTVTTKSDLGISTGDCIVDGGTLVYDATSTDAWNRIVLTGGLMQYNGTGTLTEGLVLSGTLDMTQDSRAKTITTLIIGPGGNFHTHDDITVTNLIDLRLPVPVFP
jgi:hypothetical protein